MANATAEDRLNWDTDLPIIVSGTLDEARTAAQPQWPDTTKPDGD